MAKLLKFKGDKSSGPEDSPKLVELDSESIEKAVEKTIKKPLSNTPKPVKTPTKIKINFGEEMLDENDLDLASVESRRIEVGTDPEQEPEDVDLYGIGQKISLSNNTKTVKTAADSKPKKLNDKDVEDIDLDLDQNELTTELDDERLIKDSYAGQNKTPNVAKKRFNKFLLVVFILAAVVGGIALTPTSRYLIMNKVGIRVSTELRVIENSSQKPLADVEVQIDGQKQTSGSDGKVKFSSITQGPKDFIISRPGYKTIEFSKTLGYGSNPLLDVVMQADGNAFKVKLVDWLTALPIKDATVQKDKFTSLSDDQGEASINIGVDSDQVDILIKASGYIDHPEKISSKDQTTIKLIRAGSLVYFLKTSDKNVDLIVSNMDGGNKKTLQSFSPTGLKYTIKQGPEGMSLVEVNQNAQNSLYLIDKSREIFKVGQSKTIVGVGWLDKWMVYHETENGKTSLRGYDPDQKNTVGYLIAESLDDVALVPQKGKLIAATTTKSDNTSKVLMFDKSGTTSETISNQKVFKILNSQDKTYFNMSDKWYAYDFDAKQISKTAEASKPNLVLSTFGADKAAININNGNTEVVSVTGQTKTLTAKNAFFGSIQNGLMSVYAEENSTKYVYLIDATSLDIVRQNSIF